jgi:hypothetical protein
MKKYMWKINPLILNFGTVRRWVVNSGPDRFNSGKNSGKHWAHSRSNVYKGTAGFGDGGPKFLKNLTNKANDIRI